MNYKLSYATLLSFALTLSSCGIVKGIFKAGMWVGVLSVALVVGVGAWIAMKFRK